MSANVLNLGKVVGQDGLGVPSPTQADAGKVPTVTPDGSGYELKSFENNSSGTIVDLGEQEINMSSPTMIDLSEEQNQAMQQTDTIGVKVSIKDSEDTSIILYLASKNIFPNTCVYSAYVPTVYAGSGSPFSLPSLVALYSVSERQVALLYSNEMPYIPSAREGDLGMALVVTNVGQLGYKNLSFPTTTLTTSSFGTIDAPVTVELTPTQKTSLQQCERIKVKYGSTVFYMYKVNHTEPPRYVNYDVFSCLNYASTNITYYFVQADYEGNAIRFLMHKIPVS